MTANIYFVYDNGLHTGPLDYIFLAVFPSYSYHKLSHPSVPFSCSLSSKSHGLPSLPTPISEIPERDCYGLTPGSRRCALNLQTHNAAVRLNPQSEAATPVYVCQIIQREEQDVLGE